MSYMIFISTFFPSFTLTILLISQTAYNQFYNYDAKYSAINSVIYIHTYFDICTSCSENCKRAHEYNQDTLLLEIIIAANATISRHIVYTRTYLFVRACLCMYCDELRSELRICVVMSYEDQLVKHRTSIPKIVPPWSGTISTMVRDNFSS